MSSNEAAEKIEQLVFDENKVVTYKLLSNELNVHVNKAKQLLNEYITNHCTKGKNDLNVYYAVSGFQKYNGHKIHKLAVVAKDELEGTKKGFSTLASIHIYSIQKCPSLDECSLYTSDYLLARSSDAPNVFSAIKHPNLKIRESRVTRSVDLNGGKKTTTTESQAVKKIEQKSSGPAQKTNALFTAWQKKEQKNKTAEQNGLPPAVKNEDNNSLEKNSRSPPKASKAADKGNKNNIMNLFSKQAVKSTSRVNTQNAEKSVSQNSVSNEVEEEEKQERKTEEKAEIRKGEQKAKHVEVKSKKKETSQKKRQKQKRSHNISEDDSDDEWKKPKKKHRRIVAAFSDSDSESEEEKKDRAQRSLMDSESPIKIECNGIEDDDEELIPPTPTLDEEEPIPSAPLNSTTNGKRKKLKIVNKTFEDEDGFLVTQKVKEYVTDSEESDGEAASHAKVIPKAVPKPDIKKNFVNKKQSSLMSFFKQK